jgi:hypothetical protein
MSEGPEPLVRKSWLIAMAIVFVSLVAVLYVVLGGGEGEMEVSLGRWTSEAIGSLT